MNIQGVNYCKKMEELYNKLPQEQRFYVPHWSDSALQERIMRLGIEDKAFEISDDPVALERVARATIIEDKLKSYETTL